MGVILLFLGLNAGLLHVLSCVIVARGVWANSNNLTKIGKVLIPLTPFKT